jgi:type IV pilus assembly protein PilM
MRPSRILALDVGAAHLAAGVFTTGATGRLVLQHFAFESHHSDPAHEARWFAELGQSFGAIAAAGKLGGACAVGVPGHLALTKLVKTPVVPASKRDRVMAFEAAENIPYPLEEVIWDYTTVADDGFDLEVVLAAAKLDAMQALCAAADAAGLAVERALPAGLALRSAFLAAHPDRREPVLVIDVGARSTSLLFLDGERLHLRTLALAGNTLTQAIAEELRLEFAPAEALKVQVLGGRSDLPAHSPARVAVRRASEAFAAKLQLEITRSTFNYRRHTGGVAPASVHLTGGGAAIAELPAELASRLKLRVERYDPLANVDLSADARAAGADSARHSLASLVGLATPLQHGGERVPNLLPPAVARAATFRQRQPWFAAAAAMAVVALLPPIVYLDRRVKAADAELVRTDEALMPLHATQARNDDNLRRIEEARKQIDALHSAYETRSSWLAFCADLQEQLTRVGDVWLDRLQVLRSADLATETTPPAGDATAAPKPLRLRLSGRLLDVANPQSRVSRESTARAKQLLASLRESPFVADVVGEQYDNRENGLLHFDFTLVVNPKHPL